MNSKQTLQLALDHNYIKVKDALKILNIIKFGKLTCELCKKPMSTSTTDHVIPKSKGGSNEFSNLRLTHANCNLVRGNKFKIKDLIFLLF